MSLLISFPFFFNVFSYLFERMMELCLLAHLPNIWNSQSQVRPDQGPGTPKSPVWVGGTQVFIQEAPAETQGFRD